MFICAAWRRRVEGPMDSRRTLVNRCDLEDGHEGRHCDKVLLVSWDDEESEAESKPRNEWNEQPKAGKTLADFVGSEPGKLFKRPMHGCAYGFDRSGYLKEYVNGGTYWPRLNVEDLTATDWEEVTW